MAMEVQIDGSVGIWRQLYKERAHLLNIASNSTLY
jgi:hypothetical protein